ncbi:MAG TPA: inositol monophosphatase family protein [Fimbriimonadaceae bacterium]|nr:inositol monophosphatase family protein [Fimbriimonadaceae bacterium]
MPEPASLLQDLEPIVREAGGMAKEAQQGATREIKPDGSIVTPADREVETFLRGELARILPSAGINGEEHGCTPEGEAGLWCVDPIDGTSNYAFGLPTWGVSVGLVKGEETLLGAVYLPALGEMYLGAQGAGATLNGQKLALIPPGEIRPEELVSCADRVLRMYPDSSIPGKMRHTGAFVIDAVYTAAQRYRGLIGLREKLHDIAACLCIAREVGAEIRYADGSPLLLEPLKEERAKLVKSWIIFPAETGFHLP